MVEHCTEDARTVGRNHLEADFFFNFRIKNLSDLIKINIIIYFKIKKIKNLIQKYIQKF